MSKPCFLPPPLFLPVFSDGKGPYGGFIWTHKKFLIDVLLPYLFHDEMSGCD